MRVSARRPSSQHHSSLDSSVQRPGFSLLTEHIHASQRQLMQRRQIGALFGDVTQAHARLQAPGLRAARVDDKPYQFALDGAQHRSSMGEGLLGSAGEWANAWPSLRYLLTGETLASCNSTQGECQGRYDEYLNVIGLMQGAILVWLGVVQLIYDSFPEHPERDNWMNRGQASLNILSAASGAASAFSNLQDGAFVGTILSQLSYDLWQVSEIATVWRILSNRQGRSQSQASNVLDGLTILMSLIKAVGLGLMSLNPEFGHPWIVVGSVPQAIINLTQSIEWLLSSCG